MQITSISHISSGKFAGEKVASGQDKGKEKDLFISLPSRAKTPSNPRYRAYQKNLTVNPQGEGSKKGK